MCKVPITALHDIVYDPKYGGVNIRREVATAIERHESQVSRFLSGKADLDHNQSARLGRHLSARFGELRWSRCFVGGTHLILLKPAGSSNGRWDDDAAKLLDYGGAWVRAMDEGDPEKAQEMLDKIRTEVLSDMQAERDRL